MLSRSTTTSNEDYVMPVTYYSSHEENESARLNGAASPNECVLDSLTSNHFSSDGSSNLKRRQSSEDFLELERAREYCRHHCGTRGQYYNGHRYEDFSASSPDYEYEEEGAEGNEAMVDEDDPLEMARQGTVHLWENSDSSTRAFCNFSDDAYINSNSHSAAAMAFTATTSESDDAVLYTHDEDLVT